MTSDFQALDDRRESGGEASTPVGKARLGRVAATFAPVRGARWPLRLAFGAALALPWVVLRVAIFGVSPDLPYLVFYPAVAMAAAIGGLAAGAGATTLAVLAATLWLPPSLTPDYLARFCGFVFFSAVICGLSEAMLRAQWRLGEAEGRRAVAEKLLIASERFRLASGGGRIGTFNLDFEKNIATDTEAMRVIFGLPPVGIVDTARVVGLTLPEDRSKIVSGLAAARDPNGDGAYEAEYRIHRENDGALRHIASSGQVYFEAGRAVRMIGVCRDVTEVRTAEQALVNSEAQIRRFVEQAPIEIAMLDRRMTYVAVSRRWTARYGKGLDNLVGVNHYELHPDIPDRWKAIHRLVEAGEFHSDDDDVWTDNEGRTHWVRWAAFPWTNSAGAIGGVILSAEDVSAQKEAEAALRESEQKFRNAFAESAIGFAMAKAGETIVEANDAFCRLTGYAREELRAMRLVDCVHPDDRAEPSALDERILLGEIPAYVIEHRYRRKDGETIWVRESVSLTHDSVGKPRWIVSLVEDVTGRKRIEDTAARTVAQLTAVLDGAKDAILSTDLRGVVQSINAAGEKMFGYERDEVIGRNVSLLMPTGDAERHDRYIGDYLSTGESKIIGVGRETEGQRKDGSHFPIELAVVEAAVYNELMFVGFVRDLSERRRIESRIDQLAAQRLTAIGGMAGALAHELNQPLAAIGVYLETARRMLTKPADQRPMPIEDAIERALAQVGRMGDIIGHLRDFVGHGEPDKTHQSLHALIRRAASEANAEARAGGPALTLDLSAERDEILVDPVQIGQVLTNLIRNACEAVGPAPGGRVTIATALEGDDMIRCEVADNGPGVADAVKDRLFEPLASTKATGMGIGLSISKSIVEAHYGRIWAKANLGGGATFSFALPLASGENDE